jgi:hypothetical protein
MDLLSTQTTAANRSASRNKRLEGAIANPLRGKASPGTGGTPDWQSVRSGVTMVRHVAGYPCGATGKQRKLHLSIVIRNPRVSPVGLWSQTAGESESVSSLGLWPQCGRCPDQKNGIEMLARHSLAQPGPETRGWFEAQCLCELVLKQLGHLTLGEFRSKVWKGA